MAIKTLMRGAAALALTAAMGAQALADNHEKSGGTLVIGSTQVPRHLNGAVQSGTATAVPSSQIFASPLRYDENWDPEPYEGGRNFGHLAYRVDDIYAACARFQALGVTINRPPRDGRMAFVKTPDGISIELLQAGGALPIQEPWASMGNDGSW